jgi:hypothetical protein
MHHQRWFIPRENNGLCCHQGHIQLDPDEVRLSTNSLDEDVLNRVLSQLSHEIPNAAIRTMLHSETGSTYTDQQIRNLCAGMLIDGTGTTPAERLFTYLEDSPHIRFVAMTASKNRQSLITIRTSKKDSSRIDEYNFPEDATQDPEDNPNTFARQAMQALTLQDGQTLLLGVAWISEEGMYNQTLQLTIYIVITHPSYFLNVIGSKYFHMYPNVMGFDVTNGTNKEKRPLARGTIKTSNNKNVPFFNALLPSVASWVFRWIFHIALPKLLSNDSLSNLHLILVDEDYHCNCQIDSAREMGILPHAQYRLCKWHKV